MGFSEAGVPQNLNMTKDVWRLDEWGVRWNTRMSLEPALATPTSPKMVDLPLQAYLG